MYAQRYHQTSSLPAVWGYGSGQELVHVECGERFFLVICNLPFRVLVFAVAVP